LFLLTTSAALHFYALSTPRIVVFDEVHFGGYINAYCGSGAYFFDIHPPHAKLLYAGAAFLGGYRGEQSFDTIHTHYDQVSPTLLRSVPAVTGTALPLVIFAFLTLLGASRWAAFLGGFAVALDNAILIQTRVIAIEGPLLLSIFGAVCAYLMVSRQSRTLNRVAWALAAGGLAGLAAGCKQTGLVALGMIGICIVVTCLRERSVEAVGRAVRDGAMVLAGAVPVYLIGWAVHFALLDQPGPGDVWGRPIGDLLVDLPHTLATMITAARDLTTGHPDASPWWSWPLMLRSVSYSTFGGHYLYFLGNPVVWWGTSLGLLLVVATPLLVRATNFSLPEPSVWPGRLWIPVCGWLLAFLPYAALTRVMFLYHYLTALLFGVCTVVLWLDHVGWIRRGRFRDQRASYFVAIVVIVLGFVAISPFTLAYVDAKQYQAALLNVLPGWR
jgi:dolichyl-phosphate-mannose-protein mannosyltransferase